MHRNRVTAYFFLIVFSFFVTGCGSYPSAKEQFYGKYELVIPDGRETLEIKNDGTYHQVFYPSSGESPILRNGTWVFNKEKREITFSNFMSIDKRFASGNLSEILKKSYEMKCIPWQKNGRVDIFIGEDTYFHQTD